MNRICIYHSKGGSSKTTLAVTLGVALGLPLCDLDPQKTATAWLARRKVPHPVVPPDAPSWVADCPPGIIGELIPVLEKSELVLIPVRASFNDLDALPDAVRFVQANTLARMAFILADIDRRTTDEGTLRDLLREYGHPVLGMLSHRASYRRAGIMGLVPADYDQVALHEITGLAAATKELA